MVGRAFQNLVFGLPEELLEYQISNPLGGLKGKKKKKKSVFLNTQNKEKAIVTSAA